ncbi:MAG: hypothetical protein ACE5DR_01105 [Thermodesulfobacteriota bacterium]
MKKIVVALCFIALMMGSTSKALAVQHHEEPSDLSVLADVALLRPIGIAMFAAEFGIFVAALPFAIITNSVGSTADVLVKQPFHYVFIRDVGDL